MKVKIFGDEMGKKFFLFFFQQLFLSFKMVKFLPNLESGNRVGDPWFVIEDEDLKQPRLLAREIVGFLSVARATASLLGRVKPNGSAVTIGEVQHVLRDVMVAWFRNANYRIGGLARVRARGPWVAERERLFRAYRNGGRTVKENAAEMYQRRFQGDIRRDIQGLFMPAQAAGTIPEIAFENSKEVIRERYLPERLPNGKRRRYRIVMEERTPEFYTIEITAPLTNRELARQGEGAWKRLGAILFPDAVMGGDVMKRLAGRRRFENMDLERVTDPLKRIRLESSLVGTLEAQARAKGIERDRRDRRLDDFDDFGDNLDQQQQQQQQNGVPEGMTEMYKHRMEEFLKFSDEDKAAFGSFGGWVDPTYPEADVHDLMDIIYAFFPFAKLFFDGAEHREIYNRTSYLVHWNPDMFLVYERNVNVPILLAMHLIKEPLWMDSQDTEVTIGDMLRESMNELIKEQNMAPAIKCSYFYYRVLGLVVGYYGVMRSRGIYGPPSHLQRTEVFMNHLRFDRILGVFDQIEREEELDMERDANLREAVSIANNRGFTVQEEASREPRLNVAFPINEGAIRGYSRVAVQHELAPFFSGTIEQLLKPTIVHRVTRDGAERLDMGVEFPEKFFLAEVFGDLLKPCDPTMFFIFLKAVEGGAMAALIKLTLMERIHPERNEMYWRCRFVRPVEDRDLDIDITVNPRSLDEPTEDPGNALKVSQYFSSRLGKFSLIPKTNFGKRVVGFVFGTAQYVSDVDDFADRVPPPDVRLLEFKACDCKYVGKVSVRSGNQWSVQRVNQWEHSVWAGVVNPVMLKRYAKSLERMILFRGDSCFYKAMNCTCHVTGLIPRYCDCPESRKEAGEVKLGDIPGLIEKKWPTKNVMVVAFLVCSKFDHDSEEKEKMGEMIQVVYQSEGFYEADNNTVILIGVPDWEDGVGHCAVWRNEWKGPDDIERFRYMKEFNKFLRAYLSNPQEVCPICGAMYMFGTDNIHFIQDTHDYYCSDCGFGFDDEEQLRVHQEYHCKKPRYGAKLELKDEEVVYKDKGHLESDVAVIYADLESAIDETGKHNNILAGWVVMDEKREVQIERTDSQWSAVTKMLFKWAEIKKKTLLIYFHNGKGYDFHFIIEEMCKMGKVFSEFEIIADSSEKVSYFQCKCKNKVLKFRDTFAFVTTSLEKWTESTVASGCEFPVYTQTFTGQDEKRGFMRKKNPFPYAAIQKAEDLDQGFVQMITWAFSENAEELFCFKYKKEELREIALFWMRKFSDYGWETVYDYYCDYLRCDVSQLADNMEFFRKTVLDEFDVDPHQYYGTPSLTWAIWMKSISGKPDMKMELITNPVAYDIINSSIRGGQTGAMTRLYDVDEDPNTFVCDLDCNSLYPTVMKFFSFPVRKWEVVQFTDAEATSEFDSLLERLKGYHARGRSGFIEVDFDVIDDEQFYSYVPIASKRTVSGVYETQAMVEYCEEYGQDVDHIFFSGLTQVMGRHEHYCCHTKLLEWYLEHHVIRLLKLHRIVTGEDAPVFREYVTRNLEKRAEAGRNHDPIKKMLYKLMNNSLYGKTYEDVTKRSSFELVRKEVFASMDPGDVYREVRDLPGGWKLIETKKLTCELNKPFYLGAAITEFSKLWMYRFFYDRIRKVFPYPKTEVLYTDTDALTICFRDCGIKSMRDLAHRLNRPTPGDQIIDTSNFREPMLGDEHNAHNEEAGLFKSETGEARILRMVALRAKTYVMECEGGEVKMSVKGCPMVEKTRLSFDLFKRVLMGGQIPYEIHFNAIRSEGHLVYNRELSRVVLSADDRKRYILPDHIHTAPLFSKVHMEALGKIQIPDDFEISF